MSPDVVEALRAAYTEREECKRKLAELAIRRYRLMRAIHCLSDLTGVELKRLADRKESVSAKEEG